MKRVAIYLATVLLLAGCVGAGVIHPKTVVLDRFSIASWKSLSGSGEVANPTKSEVAASWGTPDHVSVQEDNDSEVWRYRTGLKWIGIVPMIGIGIPLAIPVWSNGVNITFVGNKATQAEQSFNTWSGGYFGLKDEGSMDYGFCVLKN